MAWAGKRFYSIRRFGAQFVGFGLRLEKDTVTGDHCLRIHWPGSCLFLGLEQVIPGLAELRPE